MKNIFKGSCFWCFVCWKISSLEENKIPLPQLQSLESDGPNCNETAWNKLNEQNPRREKCGKYIYIQPSFMPILSRKVFKCLVKTSLNLSLVCIYGFKLFKFMACWLVNFWNTLNQDCSLWLQLHCELLNSLSEKIEYFQIVKVQPGDVA